MAKKPKTLADLKPGEIFRFKNRKDWYEFDGKAKGEYKYGPLTRRERIYQHHGQR